MRRFSISRLPAVACALLLAAGCAARGGQEKKPVSVTPPPPAARACERDVQRPYSSELLNELSLLATNAPADPQQIASVRTEADLERYLQTLVDDDRFAREIAPQMLIPHIVYLAGNYAFLQILEADKSTGSEIYFMPSRGKCSAKEAVPVHPWWALQTTVRVCPSSYQPTHLRLASSKLYCGAAKDPYCGCGPNLAFCAKGPHQVEMVADSLRNEIIAIVARAVKTDAPIDDIYLTNETERDRNAEFIYRRWRISAGEPADQMLAKIDEWPTSPKLAPRFESTPRQHAGILTAAGTLDIEAGLRGRMKWFYDALWCDEPPAGGVTTEAILSLKGNNLRRGDDWQRLSTMPVCTDCHARLDYGMRFFSGFGVLFAYDPKDHEDGRGPLYGANIRDPRGEGSLDPRSFGELAV